MAGVEKILIPIKPRELTIDKVIPYLPTILEKFNKKLKRIGNIFRMYKIYLHYSVENIF